MPNLTISYNALRKEAKPNSGKATTRILDNLVWILHAGDFSYHEFVKARYGPNTKTAAIKFLRVLENKGWIRRAYEPAGGSNMHDYRLYCINKNHVDVVAMLSIVRHEARGHAMGPIG